MASPPLHDVAIVAVAQSTSTADPRNEQEMLLPLIDEVTGLAGVATEDLGFVCSGSADYLVGAPFSFVAALDAVGPWPPLRESHVEMDGAWALFEAYLWLSGGEADTALVYSFGKTSTSDVPRTLALQLDPYNVAPLFPDSHGLAGLQARALLDAGLTTEDELAEIAARSSTAAADNLYAVRSGRIGASDVLDEPATYAPLRALQTPPVTDGAVAVLLATGDRARELTDTPAWIAGIDHRIDPPSLGARDLTDAPSARLAAQGAGVNGAPIDLAELHARYAHEEVVLRRAIGLSDDTVINPSGGPLGADPVMATGLIRLAEAARRVQRGEGDRAVAHASSGPCLQQNLVAVLEVR